MKKILISALIAISAMGAKAQKVFCLQASCKQTITVGDSVNVFAQLTATDGFKAINWAQTTGPAMVPVPQQTVTPSSTLSSQLVVQASSSFTLKKLIAGTYIFSATGSSMGGSQGMVTDTIVVNPAIRRIAYVLTVYSDSSRVQNQ